MKILVIHGPNLNLLGEREEEIYGSTRLEEINSNLTRLAKEKGAEIQIVQSNHEGEIVDQIGQSRKEVDCMIINPAAYTHTSVAIRDAISAIKVPVIEVHLSNIYKREDFRQKSLLTSVCEGQISGFGANSYYLALDAALELLKK